MKKDIKDFFDDFKNMAVDLTKKDCWKKQIPNLITLSRLGLACFIPPLALSGNLIAATIITTLAAITDAFDGFAARKLNAISNFGKNLDPVCDKLFAGILIVPLLIKAQPIIAIGLGINLILDAGIAGINLISKIKGNKPSTIYLGKIKTVLLSILLGIIYLSFSISINPAIILSAYSLTASTQLLTLCNYYKIEKKKNKEKEKRKNDLPIIQESIDTSDKSKSLKPTNSEYYTLEDYEKLKEETIKLYILDQNLEQTNTNGNQKIKK